jgi:serine/threonine-protein kinase RsbW
MTTEVLMQLSVPSLPEYIGVVRLIVSSLASARRAFSDERLDDLRLAVSEACTNAIEANAAAGGDAPVVVTCREGPERFEVCISDSGRGFDPTGLPLHPPVTDPERLNFERGLGIPIIRALVDDLRFESGSGGTSVWLTLFGGPAPEEGDRTDEIVRVVIAEGERP